MPCILLHSIGAGDELKEVAEGIIVQPMTREMHNTRMSAAVMKVRLTTVVPKFCDIDPPMQSPGAEDHMVFGRCLKWIMEWPKT